GAAVSAGSIGPPPRCQGKSKAYRVPDRAHENFPESVLRALFWCENRPPTPLWVRHDRQNGDRMEFPDRRPPRRSLPRREGPGASGDGRGGLVTAQPDPLPPAQPRSGRAPNRVASPPVWRRIPPAELT